MRKRPWTESMTCKIIKIALSVFTLFFGPTEIFAKVKTYDWTLKVAGLQTTNQVSIKPLEKEQVEPITINFTTRVPDTSAFALSYKGLGASYSQTAEINDEMLNGVLETESTAFSAFYDLFKLSIEVFFIDQTGYTLENPEDLYTNWDSGQAKPSYSNMGVLTSGFSIYYTTDEEEYSISEITAQVDRIDTAFGASWIIGIQGKRTIIKNFPELLLSENNVGLVSIEDISIASLTPFIGGGLHFGYNNFFNINVSTIYDTPGVACWLCVK